MKIQQILATGALIVAVAASANADVVIRIAGSSAYRKAVNAAVTSLIGDSKMETVTFDGKAIDSTNVARLSGTASKDISYTDPNDETTIYTIPAGTKITVCTSWTGSVAGVYSLANKANTARHFIPVNAVAISGTAAASDTDSSVDVAMSDVFLGTANAVLNTDWTTDDLIEAGGGAYKGIGVCPFKWVISGTSTGVSNVTEQQIHTLYTVGRIDKNLLVSGTAAANATGKVYAFGRDSDSGTRLTAFADSSLGAVFLPTQYGVCTTATSGLATSGGYVAKVPSASVNGISYTSGQSGYSSGGDLATVIGSIATGNFTGITSGVDTGIAYLSVSDAASVVAGSTIKATELTYNGVPYTLGNIYNGAYSFWSYEHMFYRAEDTADTGSQTGLFAEALAAQLLNTTVPSLSGSDVTSNAASYVDVKQMKVKRTNDGAYLIKTN